MLTKEDILELFAKTDKQIAETNKGIFELKESQKKTDEAIDRLAARQERTDEKIDRLAESQKKTDAQLAKTDAQLAETAKQLAKTDAQLAKTDASLKRLGNYHGGLSNNVGSATEEYFYNILDKKRVLNGIHFDRVERNWGRQGGKQNDEFDIVMLNGTAISVIEVKLKAHKDDVEKILTTQKKRFNEIFPEYKDYEQHWALATFSIDDKLRKKAVEKGLTVLQRKGDLIEHNPPMPGAASKGLSRGV